MNAIPTELTLFDAGCCEEFKHAYHNTLWWLLVGAGSWNAVAYLKRGDPQLAVNALLYAALIAFEQAACARHRTALVSASSAHEAPRVRPREAPLSHPQSC